jgi:DNA-binding MarR family transcriptional regulator
VFTPFSFKRMVLLAGRAARAFAALAELTPARADMMIALLHEEFSQRELAWKLGVCEEVVSRMVRALEGLGHLARRTPPNDRRVRLVRLTDQGRRALDIFFDGWMADDGEFHVQQCAELNLLEHWRRELDAAGFRFDIGVADAGPLFRHIRRTHAQREYWADSFPDAEARAMRCHRVFKKRRTAA